MRSVPASVDVRRNHPGYVCCLIRLSRNVIMPSSGNTSNATAIVARRFRTRVCQIFMDDGVCPYDEQCIFAYGEHELRTPKQNVADGITSRNGIYAFRRREAGRCRASSQNASQPSLPGGGDGLSPGPQQEPVDGPSESGGTVQRHHPPSHGGPN